MGKMMRMKFKGRNFWYFQERDMNGIAQEFIFTNAEMRTAQKRAEHIHSRPMKEYELFEVF